MSKILGKPQRVLAVFALLISMFMLVGCAGRVSYKILIDNEGNYDYYIEVVVDPNILTPDDLSEIHLFLVAVDMSTAFDLVENQPANTYLLHMHIDAATVARSSGGEPSEHFTRTEEMTFFTRTITIQDKTVFHGLNDFINGAPVPEDNFFMCSVFENLYGVDDIIITEGLAPLISAEAMAHANEIELFFTYANTYNGFFGSGTAETIGDMTFFTWDLTGNPDALISYGQQLPNPAGWYTLLVIGTLIFIAASYFAVKIFIPKVFPKLLKSAQTIHGNMSNQEQQNQDLDPFDDYK